MRVVITTFVLFALAACAGGGEDGLGGRGGKTDEGDGSGYGPRLDGHQDAMAAWLREAAGPGGVVPGDYRTLLDGVGEALGCGVESERTFVILLTKAELFPRNIVTRCSDDPAKASAFFLTTQSDRGDLADIDPRNLRALAWDEGAQRYRRYEMTDDGEGGMVVSVEPEHCLGCHTGPRSMAGEAVPFAPVMNELVNPWTLWNAEPEFRSHRFDDTLDPALRAAPIYAEMTQPGRLDSAANFEKHIRAGVGRVVNARLRARRDPPSLEQSLDLLRPLFCDETVNYVSENHFTGETRADVIIDDAIRRLYLTLRPDDWPWDWLNDGKLRLTLPAAGEEPIAVMPVRGEANIQVELALVSRRVLTAQQALRVRALDWTRPVFSAMRCELFRHGAERARIAPPDMSGLETNSDLIRVLYDEIMQIRVTDPATGERRLAALAPADPQRVLVVDDAEDPAAQDALAAGDLVRFEMTLEELGGVLQARFDAAHQEGHRASLEAERLRRGCVARAEYPAAPHIPGTEGCAAQ